MSKHELTNQLSLLYPVSKGLKTLLEDGNIHRKQFLKKKDTLLLPRMRVDETHFLYTGMCKGFWKNLDNEEEIFAIWVERNFIFLDEFFFSAENESAYIVMLEDSVLYSLTVTQMNEIYSNYPEARILTNMLRKQARDKRDLHLSILMKPASQRYVLFVKHFREFYNRLSVKDICAFLCICEKTYKISRSEWFLKGRKRVM